jgi:23S rRNA pseudouridine1911/1915/1917 synthase
MTGDDPRSQPAIIRVPPPDDAWDSVRLDRFLADRLPAVSRRDVARWIAGGLVRVDGRAARKGELLRGGEEVRVAPAAPRAAWRARPDATAPLAVLFEDEHLVAIDKPAGVPCHPLRPDESGTIANALAARFPETSAIGPPLEAGLVHRLDTETSGVLIAARSAGAYAALRRAWGSPRVEKIYLAIVAGIAPASGTIEAPIAAHPRSARRVIAAPGGETRRGARPARTDYERIAAREPSAGESARSLLRVRLWHGRRHQIRAHLASIGHPIEGDALYAPRGSRDEASPAAPPARLALHAHQTRFRHPITGGELAIESPLPEALARLMQP